MMTICLIAYLTVTCLFVGGLAFAAAGPIPGVPEMQILRQKLAQGSAEDVAIQKAA
jgi:hypothetical protein